MKDAQLCKMVHKLWRYHNFCKIQLPKLDSNVGLPLKEVYQHHRRNLSDNFVAFSIESYFKFIKGCCE